MCIDLNLMYNIRQKFLVRFINSKIKYKIKGQKY